MGTTPTTTPRRTSGPQGLRDTRLAAHVLCRQSDAGDARVLQLEQPSAPRGPPRPSVLLAEDESLPKSRESGRSGRHRPSVRSMEPERALRERYLEPATFGL